MIEVSNEVSYDLERDATVTFLGSDSRHAHGRLHLVLALKKAQLSARSLIVRLNAQCFRIHSENVSRKPPCKCSCT